MDEDGATVGGGGYEVVGCGFCGGVEGVAGGGLEVGADYVGAWRFGVSGGHVIVWEDGLMYVLESFCFFFLGGVRYHYLLTFGCVEQRDGAANA